MVYLPPAIPPALRPQVEDLVAPLSTFAKLHKVQDKDSKKLIPLDPLPMQLKIFEAVEAGHNRIIVQKARQVAATTGAKMVLHHLAYTTSHEAMCAIISMREDSATALLDDFRRWLDDPPSLLRRPIATQARNRIKYGDTGAELRAFTSRSQTGVRSFQPIAALVSEAAFAPDLAEVVAQADAAVGEGLLILESTAQNPGDHWSRLVQGAPENGWHLLTMWWWEHPAYVDPDDQVAEDFEPDEAERQLAERYNLTRGQLHWRRRKVLTLGEAKFRREYPACLDDCFLGREGGYYGDELLQQIQRVDGNEIEAPNRADRYVVGVDVGGGVGGDYSTLCVVSVGTRQPVYFERSNEVTPAQWAHRVIQVASRYNQALVLAESNNHGHALLLELNSCGYRVQWRDPRGRPWTTTLKSKLEALDTLREALPLIQVMPQTVWLELRGLTIPPGKVAPEAPKGAHDDGAIACALAYRCLRDVPSTWRNEATASTKTRIDDLIKSARARRIRSHGLPF